jgi:hypothetical protein
MHRLIFKFLFTFLQSANQERDIKILLSDWLIQFFQQRKSSGRWKNQFFINLNSNDH